MPFQNEYPFGESVSIFDHFGVRHYLAPNGEIVALPLYRLAGDQFGTGVLDTTVWTPSLGVGGSASVATGELVLSTGLTANNAVSVVSNRIARFAGLQPNKIRIPATVPDPGQTGNVRDWGVADAANNNGVNFRRNGTAFQLVRRKGGVDTPISSGSFNGQFGPRFDPGIDFHFYEILWQPRQIQWYADNKLIHTFIAGNTPWTLTMNFGIRLSNANSGGLSANLALNCRLATITRFGIPEMAVVGDFTSGITAGKVLKYSGGRLWGLIISSITNNSAITLYDNTTASGTVIWQSGAMPANAIPFDLDFHGRPFNNGLTLVIATANCDVAHFVD